MKRHFLIYFYVITLFFINCAGGGTPQESNNTLSSPQVQRPQSTSATVAPVRPVYWTGDGGRGLSLGILVPESVGLDENLAYLPVMVQGVLVANISRYSAISVLDRESLDRVIAETLDPTYEDNFDIVRLGHVAHVNYMLTGRIIRTSTGYTLQINVTDTTPEARTLASYSGNATVAQLDDHTAIQAASQELLTQMGVQLTDRAITALGAASSQQSINAQTVLARGITAQRSGTVVEALTYYYQAESLDSSLLEAANRASIISSTITGGNIGENIRNDIERRNEWLRILREADAFFQRHLPFEILYDPTLTRGRTDYNRGTADLSFRLSINPDDTAFQVMEDIRKGLIQTRRMREWGFAFWPMRIDDRWVYQDNPSSRQNFSIIALLINSDGKNIGRANVNLSRYIEFREIRHLRSGNPNFDYAYMENRPSGALDLSRFSVRNQSATLIFSNVNVNDITYPLIVQITSVNGVDVQDPANQGYIRISTGSLQGVR